MTEIDVFAFPPFGTCQSVCFAPFALSRNENLGESRFPPCWNIIIITFILHLVPSSQNKNECDHPREVEAILPEIKILNKSQIIKKVLY
jgi:hypothetical protein